jgi:hypothetical protein|tara:strand:+ start:330 stop:638 length:309 start_codon:yes stop_codon:yes gene_type:complete
MSTKYDEVKISKSDRDKKFKAVFYLNGNKKKTLHFGAKGMKDYTLHNINVRDEKKKNYIARHKVRENWKVPDTPGSLSRWVLWNKTTLKASIDDYKKKFNLK